MKVGMHGEITMNFYDDVLQSMNRDEKLELAQMLCMEDEVLDHFVDELMNGYASPTMNSHIHKARQKFLAMMPLAAGELIRALNAEVQRAKDQCEHYRDEAFRLGQFWPTGVSCQEPGCNGHHTFRQPERKPYPVTNTPMSDEIMKACGLEPIKVNDELEESCPNTSTTAPTAGM